MSRSSCPRTSCDINSHRASTARREGLLELIQRHLSMREPVLGCKVYVLKMCVRTCGYLRDAKAETQNAVAKKNQRGGADTKINGNTWPSAPLTLGCAHGKPLPEASSGIAGRLILREIGAF